MGVANRSPAGCRIDLDGNLLRGRPPCIDRLSSGGIGQIAHNTARDSSCQVLTMYLLVNACQPVRKMRGGAQAHLIECDDGLSYVVKFRNNPQHRRILVNEWLGSVILDHLQISSPTISQVNVSAEFLEAHPDVFVQLGSRRLEVEPGPHFGSRYAGSDKSIVYDFLPDPLLTRVRNLNQFLGVLAFDKWVGNVDTRQAVFVRQRSMRNRPAELTSRCGYDAQMLDEGYIFGGPDWTFQDSPLQGLYFRPSVYASVASIDDFQPWLDRVLKFPAEALYAAIEQIPAGWLVGEESALDRLITRLMLRRNRVPDLISSLRCGRANPFPAWI